jgi:hypothetical protein
MSISVVLYLESKWGYWVEWHPSKQRYSSSERKGGYRGWCCQHVGGDSWRETVQR